jgi:tetratricopeptide (TPR) repeat protein
MGKASGRETAQPRGLPKAVGEISVHGIRQAEAERPKRTAAGLARCAEEFMAAREFDCCLYLCRLAVAEDPNEPLSYFVRGRCLDDIGRFDEALEALALAVTLDSANADFQAAYGQALEHTGQLEEARLRYGLALGLDRDLIGPLLARALVSQQLGDFAGALADLDAYLGHRPDSTDALIHRGLSHLAAGRRDHADIDFDRAIALDPNACERIKRLTGGV